MTSTPTVFGALLLASLSAFSTASHATAEIHGAGATFPSAVYKSWADSYGKSHDAKVTYQPTG